jgi:hypothetical protein
VPNGPTPCFFAGDLGQRIFQQPFSWKSLGVDIRGRSRTLRINYRTSHQIRQQADRLLGEQTVDVDGNADTRSDTVSVFNGPPPVIRVVKDESEEIKTVGAWLAEQSSSGNLAAGVWRVCALCGPVGAGAKSCCRIWLTFQSPG